MFCTRCDHDAKSHYMMNDSHVYGEHGTIRCHECNDEICKEIGA